MPRLKLPKKNKNMNKPDSNEHLRRNRLRVVITPLSYPLYNIACFLREFSTIKVDRVELKSLQVLHPDEVYMSHRLISLHP